MGPVGSSDCLAWWWFARAANGSEEKGLSLQLPAIKRQKKSRQAKSR